MCAGIDTNGDAMKIEFDEIDQDILGQRTALRDGIEGPRIGDYVRFATGEIERFSHDFGEVLQTSPRGSFYLSGCGNASLSCGSLNPPIPASTIKLTEEKMDGAFWFFHHGSVGPHRRVNCTAPCRVYQTSTPYDGFVT